MYSEALTTNSALANSCRRSAIKQGLLRNNKSKDSAPKRIKKHKTEYKRKTFINRPE